MPYLSYFNLSDRPFSLTPNTQLYFPAERHQRILMPLIYAVKRGEGIIKIVGEVGTGKTMMCRLLLSALDEPMETAYLNNPQSDPAWLNKTICHEFGLEPGDDPIKTLYDFLIEKRASGRRALIAVDEAQALDARGLEEIRRLSNLETNTDKLLQIVMFGQPELDRMLNDHELRQVNQRIGFSFTLEPLTENDTIGYINHRLRLTCQDRATAATLFDEASKHDIAELSGGVPRLINILADKALMAAFGDNALNVSVKHVTAAANDTPNIMVETCKSGVSDDRRKVLRLWIAGLLATVAAIGAAALIVVLGGG
ncbi:MAG: AAA family ATPase [Pseudomonadota bacterium]|nr:AAA family ATPase [Pseudomonadota bacterium]